MSASPQTLHPARACTARRSRRHPIVGETIFAGPPRRDSAMTSADAMRDPSALAGLGGTPAVMHHVDHARNSR